MKKYLLPLFALFLTACAFTPFLWQQERAGVSNAQIDKIGEDRYYVTTSKWNELEVFELNAAGALHHLSSIPLDSYSGLRIHWINDDEFYSLGTHGELALISLQNGVLWTIDEAQIKFLAGREAEESHSPIVYLKVSDSGVVFLFANITFKNTYEKVGLVAQVSPTGEITNVVTRKDGVSITFRGFLEDGYLLEWLVRTGDEAAEKVLQKRYWNGEVALEHIIDLDRGVALATANEYFLIDLYDESPVVTAYDWDQQERYQFSVSEDIATRYNTKIKPTEDNSILVYSSSKGIEKRSIIDGSLIWEKTFEERTFGWDIRLSDNGTYTRIVTNLKDSVAGVTLEVNRDEDGNVLFSGNQTFHSEYMISYETGDLASGAVNTITQQGAVFFYDFKRCLFGEYRPLEVNPSSGGCYPETRLDKQGSIEVFDYELLEDGGILTLTNYAIETGDPDSGDTYHNKLLITRYK